MGCRLVLVSASLGLATLLWQGGAHSAYAETAQSEPPGEISVHFDAKSRLGKKDIVSTLNAEGRFESLLKMLNAAGMIPLLRTHGPLTMFVPTDDAFAKLPASTLERWQKDPQQLKQILRYHVLKAYVPARQVLRLRNALTASGGIVRIDASSSNGPLVIKINSAVITRSDILTANGILHVIDTVLVPPERPIKLEAEKKTKKIHHELESAGGHQS